MRVEIVADHVIRRADGSEIPVLGSAAPILDAQGAILVSACSGIFLLAETGLFDGRDATVHFAYAKPFAAAHPDFVPEALGLPGGGERVAVEGVVLSFEAGQPFGAVTVRFGRLPERYATGVSGRRLQGGRARKSPVPAHRTARGLRSPGASGDWRGVAATAASTRSAAPAMKSDTTASMAMPRQHVSHLTGMV